MNDIFTLIASGGARRRDILLQRPLVMAAPCTDTVTLSQKAYHHCSYIGVCQIRSNLARNLAGAEFGRIWEKWPDFGFAEAEIRCNLTIHWP